jgi:Tol biopolymer transport system component
VASDGTDLRKLTDNRVRDTAPAASPDGRRIAFTSYRDGNGEIYVMNADGSRLRRLTNTPGNSEDAPSFSPDGRMIVFTSFDGGGVGIYAMNAADGSSTHQVLAGNPNYGGPNFSPGGRKILYAADRGLGGTAYTIDPDGRNGSILFAHPQIVYNPTYSPDGQSIVFDDRNNAFWKRDSGGSFTQIAPDHTGLDASISPDGSKIAYTGEDDDLAVMNADGGSRRKLTNLPGNDRYPTWMAASPYDDTTQPSLQLSAVQLNKHRGTASVSAQVSRKGALSISGTGASSEQRALNGAGTSTIALRAAGSARKKLKRKGKATVSLTVTYTAEIGDPVTKSVAVKLVKSKKRKQR